MRRLIRWALWSRTQLTVVACAAVVVVFLLSFGLSLVTSRAHTPVARAHERSGDAQATDRATEGATPTPEDARATALVDARVRAFTEAWLRADDPQWDAHVRAYATDDLMATLATTNRAEIPATTIKSVLVHTVSDFSAAATVTLANGDHLLLELLHVSDSGNAWLVSNVIPG